MYLCHLWTRGSCVHGCTVDALRVTKTLVRNLDTRVRASRQTQSMRASINAPSLLTAAWRWLEIGDRRSQNGSCNSAAQGGKAQWATYGSDGVQIGDRRMEAGRARPRRFWEEGRSQKARPKGHRAGRGSENRGWKGATQGVPVEWRSQNGESSAPFHGLHFHSKICPPSALISRDC